LKQVIRKQTMKAVPTVHQHECANHWEIATEMVQKLLWKSALFGRGSAQDLSAQSSLYWDEWCFCVKNRLASHGLVIHLGMTCLTTIARVVPSRTKCVLIVLWWLKCAATILHRRLVLETVFRDLLHYLWRIGLAATSPMHWRAHLPWMSHERMSPAWGCSVHAQLHAI